MRLLKINLRIIDHIKRLCNHIRQIWDKKQVYYVKFETPIFSVDGLFKILNSESNMIMITNMLAELDALIPDRLPKCPIGRENYAKSMLAFTLTDQIKKEDVCPAIKPMVKSGGILVRFGRKKWQKIIL